jgi:hypothetical protein
MYLKVLLIYQLRYLVDALSCVSPPAKRELGRLCESEGRGGLHLQNHLVHRGTCQANGKKGSQSSGFAMIAFSGRRGEGVRGQELHHTGASVLERYKVCCMGLRRGLQNRHTVYSLEIISFPNGRARPVKATTSFESLNIRKRRTGSGDGEETDCGNLQPVVSRVANAGLQSTRPGKTDRPTLDGPCAEPNIQKFKPLNPRKVAD